MKIICTSIYLQIIVKTYNEIIYQLGVLCFVFIENKNKIMIIFLLNIFIVTYTWSCLLHFFKDKGKKTGHIFILCLLHIIFMCGNKINIVFDTFF